MHEAKRINIEKHTRFKKKDTKLLIFCDLIYLKCYKLCISTDASTNIQKSIDRYILRVGYYYKGLNLSDMEAQKADDMNLSFLSYS